MYEAQISAIWAYGDGIKCHLAGARDDVAGYVTLNLMTGKVLNV
jgi:hypothetical protein